MKKTALFVALALVAGIYAAAVVMAEDAAPAKTDAKACSKPAGDKEKPAMGDRMMKHLEAAKPALTDEQKTKIQTLIDEAKKKMESATDGKAKREIMMELHKTIMETVLTAEQRESLPKRPEGRGGHDKREKGEKGDKPAEPPPATPAA